MCGNFPAHSRSFVRVPCAPSSLQASSLEDAETLGTPGLEVLPAGTQLLRCLMWPCKALWAFRAHGCTPLLHCTPVLLVRTASPFPLPACHPGRYLPECHRATSCLPTAGDREWPGKMSRHTMRARVWDFLWIPPGASCDPGGCWRGHGTALLLHSVLGCLGQVGEGRRPGI